MMPMVGYDERANNCETSSFIGSRWERRAISSQAASIVQRAFAHPTNRQGIGGFAACGIIDAP
jgi:hypothetical protein